MSSPFVRHEESHPISEVNVVPLADVSLVLLIILLVLSPMVSQSMLRVHSAAAKAPPTNEPLPPPPPPTTEKPPLPALTVELTGSGYVVESGRLLSGDAELTAWLQAELPKRTEEKDRKVFLSPALEVAHGRVVATIELLQKAGAPAVALVQVVDPQGDEPPAPNPAPAAASSGVR